MHGLYHECTGVGRPCVGSDGPKEGTCTDITRFLFDHFFLSSYSLVFFFLRFLLVGEAFRKALNSSLDVIWNLCKNGRVEPGLVGYWLDLAMTMFNYWWFRKRDRVYKIELWINFEKQY